MSFLKVFFPILNVSLINLDSALNLLWTYFGAKFGCILDVSKMYDWCTVLRTSKVHLVYDNMYILYPRLKRVLRVINQFIHIASRCKALTCILSHFKAHWTFLKMCVQKGKKPSEVTLQSLFPAPTTPDPWCARRNTNTTSALHRHGR